MQIEFDEEKSKKNALERNLPFSRALEFDFDSAILKIDNRTSSELRIKAIGYLDSRLHILVYTMRNEKIRVISFRKANSREIFEYETKSLSY